MENFKERVSWEAKASASQFWAAVDIYINKAHVINRRLIGVDVLCKIGIKEDEQLQRIVQKVSNTERDSDIQELVEREVVLSEEKVVHSKVVIVKRVLPKNSLLQPSFEMVLSDYGENRVTFIAVKSKNNTVPGFSYAFSYDKETLRLWTEEGVEESDSSYQWIVAKLAPKLVKWMESADESKAGNVGSLCLVNVSEYSALYNKLKEKYGKQLVQIWPENTDPLKFVYEDIGIATYLLLLWTDKPKQRFVDLGCGNGLLVHILNSEGHLGIGYDIRARKIWSLYPPSTKLEVRTIIPSAETVFPDMDWLIGNHSDELTVWIPVMAARSSYSCNFFLLPCCPYEFDGKKFSRVDTSVSQYSDFLKYVETVCGQCGFVTEKDKLRIPSTKRACFVGRGRTYKESEWKGNVKSVEGFVESKCSFHSGSDINEGSAPQFKPRPEERVRNCTKIHSDVRETIVNLVAEQLLAKRSRPTSGEGFEFGGVVELCALAKVIPSDTLRKLKSECGGLQTLLRNHHYIFKVQSGKVEFRVPSAKVKSDSLVWKKKPCWFHHNHPNMCPLLEEQCSFVH